MAAPIQASFFEQLVARYSTFIAYPDKFYGTRVSHLDNEQSNRVLLNTLIDPNLKRMLFDSRQAAIFHDVGEGLTFEQAQRVRLPFDRFYMEFTNPIEVGEAEPGRSTEYVRAFMLTGLTGEGMLSQGGEDMAAVPARQAVFFLDDEKGTTVDRAFFFDPFQNLALCSVHTASNTVDPSDVEVFRQLGGSPAAMFVAGSGTSPTESEPDGRYMGWWERLVLQYTDLLGWIFLYTMAKGIYTEEVAPPRAERRRLERMGVKPLPWHIVKVEPRFIQAHETETGTGRQHSYRYDVIGHLRFGKHKKGDGSYSYTVEWVRPHQRGLRNTEYIPSTHHVDGGKEIDPRFREYVEFTPDGRGKET